MPRPMRSSLLLVLATALCALLAGTAFAAQPEDAWITTKVKMQLLTAEGVDPLEIDVDTIDGVVTLHGRVASESLKQVARARAAEVSGVRDVRDLLAVIPAEARESTKASDEELRKRIETVLERDKALDDSRIQVESVNDGIVVLAGEADTLSSHRRALEDARAVDGVERVASQIRSPDELGDREIWSDQDVAVEGDGAASDMWITTRAKLKLMTDPGVSPFAINVDTRNGVVTLFGSVKNDATKQKAEQQVRQIAGVRDVENELQVVPDVAADRVQARDERVLDAVKTRLGQREALADSSIDVEVSNGVVRLTGHVASHRDRITAVTVARATEGAGSVIDDLKVEPKRSDGGA